MRHQASYMIIPMVLLLSLLNGCIGKQPTLNYYQLTPAAEFTGLVSERLPKLSISVGPVSVPEMLKRQEIVIAEEGNQYRLAVQHRWAGGLEKNLTAVILENLGKQLGTEQLAPYPWGSHFNPNYRVIVDVLDLVGQPGGRVVLRAGWTIVDRSVKPLLARKVREYQQQSSGKDIGSMIQAESRAVALMCQEISRDLITLTRH